MNQTLPIVSFIVPDMRGPVLGPIIQLARYLEGEYKVEIVGPDFGHGVHPMYKDAYPFKMVKTPHLYRLPNYWQERRWLMQAVSGDVLIPVKAYFNTLKLALDLKRQRGCKVIPYLDEWDGAVQKQRAPMVRWMEFIKNVHHPLDRVYHPIVERYLPQADHICSTSTFLQKKFGGTLLYMGVDLDEFKPFPNEMLKDLRTQYALEGKKVIVFGGVVRPHKGIEQILEALYRLNRPDFVFLIVGPENHHVQALRTNSKWAPYMITTGSQPKAHMPLFLNLGDVVVLPLDDTLLAHSQTPCKIFEALATGKPVIATEVADLPFILESCGRVVKAGDLEVLTRAIESVLTNDEERKKMGLQARERCRREFSAEITRTRLSQVVRQVWNEPKGCS